MRAGDSPQRRQAIAYGLLTWSEQVVLAGNGDIPYYSVLLLILGGPHCIGYSAAEGG